MPRYATKCISGFDIAGLDLVKLPSRTHPLVTQYPTPRYVTSLIWRTHAVLCNIALLNYIHTRSRDINMPRPDGLHGGGKFVPLHVIAKRNRERRAEKVKQSLNKEAAATQEDEDLPSEEAMELNRRDPDLCNRDSLAEACLLN